MSVVSEKTSSLGRDIVVILALPALLLFGIIAGIAWLATSGVADHSGNSTTSVSNEAPTYDDGTYDDGTSYGSPGGMGMTYGGKMGMDMGGGLVMPYDGSGITMGYGF